MGAQQPNVVAFFWDAVGWGELGCYGGGVLRGAATPRIDKLAAEGVRLLNFNVEARSIASRSALLTGRHAIRSGTQDAPVTDGPDGLTRWEVTTAPALSDAGYATGMWGAWHLGSDPENRSPVDFGFDEPVWCLRAADEVLWTMPSYFPAGPVTATPYAGETGIPLEPQPIFSRAKGSKPEVISTYDPEFRAGFDRQITGWAADFMRRSSQQGRPFFVYLPCTQTGVPPIPGPRYAGITKRGNRADLLVQMDDFTGRILDELDTLNLADDTIVVWTSGNGADPGYRMPAGTLIRSAGSGPGAPGPGAAAVQLAGGLEPCPVHHPLAAQGARGQGQQRARPRGGPVHHPRTGRRRHSARRPSDRRHGHVRVSARRRGAHGSKRKEWR